MAAGCDVGVPEFKQSGSTSRAAHLVPIQREKNGGEAESFVCRQTNKTSSEAGNCQTRRNPTKANS